MYQYTATVINVVDGDTIDVVVDLGFDTFTKQRLRFARVDAWETRGPERQKGLQAKAWLQATLNEKIEIRTTQTRKGSELRGKYGRYIAELFTLDGISINDALVSMGHAVYVNY